jgi:ABC-2 type transport system permease protein
MPGWLRAIAHANPLTYEVDALRGMMLVHGHHLYRFGLDIGVLLGATTLLVLLGGRLYPHVVT